VTTARTAPTDDNNATLESQESDAGGDSISHGEPKPDMPVIDKRLMEEQLSAFLAGESDGEELLHALYDYILAEPVPEPLRGLLRK
jgi:hypothetical protein